MTRIIAHAAVTLELDETQRKRVVNCNECGWCGLVWYGTMFSTCPVCPAKGFTASNTIGRDTGRVYQQIRRLKRKRNGTVVFKRSSYWGTNYDLDPKDWTDETKHVRYVSFACHGSGRQDPGRVPGSIFRRLRSAGSRTGGDPTLIAHHLRFIRETV